MLQSLRPVEQDADGLDLVGVLPDEAGEGRQVVLGLVLAARRRRGSASATGDGVLRLVGDDERSAARRG